MKNLQLKTTVLKLLDLLKDCPVKSIQVVKQTTSTNKVLKQLANDEGYTHDCLMVANSQTDGVGRYDRKFFSPMDSGVYFSLLINPKVDIALTTNLTVAMSVAVARAIKTCVHKDCQIKWVNDILVDDKKVCGILTEGSINIETNSMNFVVVGVGVNLYKPQGGFDQSIKNIAGGLFDSKKPNFDKNEFIATIIKNFYLLLNDLTSKELLEEYQQKLAFIGQKVDVLKNSQKVFEGQVLGVDDSFKLIVKNLEDGSIQKLDSGEISTRISK